MINPIFENCLSENDGIVAEANLEFEPEKFEYCKWCGRKLVAHINNQELVDKGFCQQYCFEAMEVYKIGK